MTVKFLLTWTATILVIVGEFNCARGEKSSAFPDVPLEKQYSQKTPSPKHLEELNEIRRLIRELDEKKLKLLKHREDMYQRASTRAALQGEKVKEATNPRTSGSLSESK